MKLRCECCGVEGEFVDGEAAYRAGWDAPPHFTQVVTCDLCPAVCVIFGKTHIQAHAHWERHGRPAKFNRFCVIDDDWGITDTALEERAEGVKAWMDKVQKGETEQ